MEGAGNAGKGTTAGSSETPSSDSFAPGDGSESDPSAATTGTTTIGLVADNSVVMASDMRASLGGRFVLSGNLQKVEQIHSTSAITLVGLIGSAQAYISQLRSEATLYETRRGKKMSLTALYSTAAELMRSGAYEQINPLLGGIDDEGCHVASVDPAGAVLRDDYAASGSGTQLAYGVLEQEYDSGLSTEEAVRIAALGIESAISRDRASGDGIYIAEIKPDGLEIHGHETFDDILSH